MTEPNFNLLTMLYASVEAHGERPALSSRTNKHWQDLTYRELWQAIHQVGSGLVRLGVKPGDSVAMCAESSPKWVVCDFGILAAGAVNVAIFPSLPPAQIEHILVDSGATLLIVGDQKLLQKALVIRETMPDLQIIVIGGEGDPAPGVWTLDEVIERGKAQVVALSDIEAQAGTDTLASLVYTSGTSGLQKGVRLTHGNFVGNVRQCQQVLQFQTDDVLLSVLPLNHVFERTAGCYLPLACGAHVYYAENLRRLRENLQEIRPTYMILVPRFLEVLCDALTDRMLKMPAARRKMFFWALEVGRQRLRCRLQERGLRPLLALEVALADSLVMRKLREAMGLDRVKDLVSGAAALSTEVNEFFHALGVEVLEGYGLTECAPVVAVNRPGCTHIGCVGPPLPDVEVRLGEHNEILVRGANVMQGYHNLPEETAQALDGEGWLHTGDVGVFDERGCLHITDRLKDLLVLSNGKNVAPQQIENLLRRSPYLSQVVVLGDKQAYVTALVVPNIERIRHWWETARTAETENGKQKTGGGEPGARAEDVIANKEVGELVRGEIKRLTEELADFEKVRDFRLLPEEFSIEGGELTATLKVRRRVVLEKWSALVKEMYK
ncbi:MAG: long-chain fatty acid--CoA ligase [Armatimonadia bacterium]